MRELIYIDGVDVYAQFGAYILDYAGVFEWPALKAVKTTKWDDEEGMEADLSAPRLDAHQVTLSFGVDGTRLYNFLNFIYAKSAREYKCPALGYTKSLRLLGCSEAQLIRATGVVVLNLSDDSPLNGYAYQSPSHNFDISHKVGELVLDGIDMTAYGCVVLAGTASSMNAYPSVGEVLAIDASNQSGELVDVSAPLIKRGKNTTIHILMRAGSVEEFWRNYNALLYDLTRPGERVVEYMGGISFQAYYNAQNIEEVSPPRYEGDSVWVKFSLSLTTLTPFYILSTEGWEAVVDESGTYYIKL